MKNKESLSLTPRGRFSSWKGNLAQEAHHSTSYKLQAWTPQSDMLCRAGLNKYLLNNGASTSCLINKSPYTLQKYLWVCRARPPHGCKERRQGGPLRRWPQLGNHEPHSQPALHPQAKLTKDTLSFLPRWGPPVSCISPEKGAAGLPSLRTVPQFPPAWPSQSFKNFNWWFLNVPINQ